MTKKLIVLDRDGVINQDRDDYIREFGHFVIYPKVAEAIAKLSNHGYLVAIATNQSALGRKITTLKTVNQIHNHLIELVNKAGGKIDYIAFCPHHPDEGCNCRKPKDGMLIEISKALNTPLKNAIMVGDSERDLIPAIKHQMKAVLVTSGKGIKTQQTMQLKGVMLVKDLLSFVDEILIG